MDRSSSLRQWLALVFAVLLLNASVTFGNVWPTLGISPRAEISVELAVLVLALSLWRSFMGRVPRSASTALAVVALFFVGGRYAAVTAPALYGRPVNLYWDAQHLPNVAAMLAEVAPWWLIALVLVGVGGFFTAIAAVLRWCLFRVAAGLDDVRARRVLGGIAAAAVAAYALGTLFDWQVRHFFTRPVVDVYRDQISFVLQARSAHAHPELPVVPLASTDLARVAKVDVLAMFLESYGAVTYDMPQIERIVSPLRQEFAAAASTRGRRVLSAFVTSPTFGGGSWLAHSTFMSGIEVREPDAYALLLTQRRATVPKLFKERGFRAVALMPGMRNDWPEGAYYGFDAIYDEKALDYRGPDFGWWRIPDQYSIASLDVLEPRAARAPLFAFFPTINTHIPFLPIPPYQPDWSRLRTAEPFDLAHVEASVSREADWLALGDPYAQSFEYTFAYLADYVRDHAPADALLVFIGDHQPAASVTGPDARWDVPVHIVTNRDDIAEALTAAGFIDGVDLAGRPTIVPMASLTTVFLRALDSGGGSP